MTSQQILRRSIPATPVRGTLRDAVTTAIATAANGNPADDWYAGGFNLESPIAGGPIAAGNFGPLRAGVLELITLVIVDAFGQPLTLATPGTVNRMAMTAARTLRPTPADNLTGQAAVLPPRLVVPTRLLFRWLSAGHGTGSPDEFIESNSHPATSPIFGWVVPNHLDDTLAFYDGAGTLIGSFGQEHGTNVYRTRPGNAANPASELGVDIGAAGSPSVNPHLASAMYAVSTLSGTALAALLATVLESERWTLPTASDRDGGISVLIGRPLALARATLNFDTAGGALPISPADTDGQDPFPVDVAADRVDYDARQAASSGNLGEVQIPVRLGDVANLDDGLVGYFIDDGSALGSFYSPYAATGAPADVVSTRGSTPIATELNAPPTTVVMLVDPRAAVHATTGLLPVTELSIPPDQFEAALRSLAVTFVCHPLLAGAPQLTVPLPALSGQAWVWVSPDGSVTPLSSNAVDGAPASDYGPQVIQDGWLQLRPAPASKE